MTSSRPDADRGAVIILFAVVLVGLLTLAAIVVDLGLARVDNRNAQSAADLAALDAGTWLSGRGGSPALPRPREACRAALSAAQANLDDLPASATIDCSSLPVTGQSPDCHGSTPARTVAATGTGSYTLTITYPVPPSSIAEAAFAGGVGVNDGDRCERMLIAVDHVRDSLFAGVAGVSSVDVHAEAVVRGSTGQHNQRVPALLLLARTDCRVLTNSAGGAGNLGIIVGSASPTQSGSVHTDTDASGCGEDRWAYGVYGDPLSDGGPSITVEDAADGTPGTLSSYAAAIGSSRAAAQYPGGISHPATGGAIVSRQPVDERYNPSDRPAIADLHTTARARVTWSAATASSNGYTVLGCGDVDGVWPDARVFVDCARWSPTSVSLPNATDLVTTGQIEVANNAVLHAPVVQRFFVRGCPSCRGGNLYGISVAGELYVNTGAEPLGGASCDSRRGPGAGGTNTNTTRMVVFGSPVQLSGLARLCQTSVYLAAETGSYQRSTATSGPPNCTTARPCPVTGSAPNSTLAVSGDVEWSAPNLSTNEPSASAPFEDLALWTETSAVIEVKSGGRLLTSGVYFAPNARMEFRSPATGLPRNAQMVVASFELLQGTLRLTPSASDGVPIETIGEYGLIR